MVETAAHRVDHVFPPLPLGQWVSSLPKPDLSGLLLPQSEQEVCSVWNQTGTVEALKADAQKSGYLPPFPNVDASGPAELFTALERIGVMFRRGDDRLDMPDLFRAAARLLTRPGLDIALQGAAGLKPTRGPRRGRPRACCPARAASQPDLAQRLISA
jgi:hypothetical protein